MYLLREVEELNLVVGEEFEYRVIGMAVEFGGNRFEFRH